MCACVRVPAMVDAVTLLKCIGQAFAEHYAFFSERNIDWNREVAKACSDATAAEETADEAVFALLVCYYMLHQA